MTDDAARLRETVAEAILEAEGLFDWETTRASDPLGVADEYGFSLSNAALNAMREAGMVIVRRDDLRSALVVTAYSSSRLPQEAHDRLRAAVQQATQECSADGE